MTQNLDAAAERIAKESFVWAKDSINMGLKVIQESTLGLFEYHMKRAYLFGVAFGRDQGIQFEREHIIEMLTNDSGSVSDGVNNRRAAEWLKKELK